MALAIAGAAGPAPAGQKPPPDLSGTWRMDLAQSQPPLDAEVSRRQARGVAIGGMPVGWGGHGGGHDRGDEAPDQGGEAGGRAGSREPGGRYGHAMLLPEWFRIAQDDAVIRLSDSTGTDVAEIDYGEAPVTTGESSPVRIRHFAGTWKGSRLDVEHDEGDGVSVTDSYWLRDKGRTLEIQTRVEYGDARPPLVFTRVYRKVGDA
ncbi:MAG TPA: hypothetical protein VI792_01395 [Candidatus Eisenbacteria bacterium]